MKRYQIVNKVSCHSFGTYRASSPEGALEALAKDAGYASRAACEEHLREMYGHTYSDELLVTEVGRQGR
jgi:hypothetical protein